MRAAAPAGGGLEALEVRVDLERAVVDANGTTIPIALERARLPAETEVVAEAIDIGRGKRVVHVRVPARGGAGSDEAAWEALLAGGRREPLFAAVTGFTEGDPGERTGQAVQVVPMGATSAVIVGDVREDLRLCGQALTLLDPRALYPDSLTLRPATVQRLSAVTRANAVAIDAVDKGASLEAPLAHLLVARGSSVPGSRGLELTDDDPKTVWHELRPGVGQGEFVVMAAPSEVPITRMQVVLAPAGAEGQGPFTVPKTFYLVTSSSTFEVSVPEDAQRKPGEAYEVVFPKPVEATCVALVLGDAYAHGVAHPDVGVAELVAYSEFDAPGATLEDVAKQLSGDRGAAAAQVLERAGPGALDAVSKAYAGLGARGRALAIDVASSRDRCEDAAPLLATALCEKRGEAPRKAREKLERCPAAAPTLAQHLRQDASSRACVAPLLAFLARADALDPIADAMAATADTERETRSTLRTAFAEALEAAPQGRLAALLGDTHRSALARLEMARAAGDRVAEAPALVTGLAGELLAASPSMRVRYLLLEPLARIARAGDPTAAARIADAVARDAEWPVRARAADLAAALPSALGALVGAVRDPEPRVREAALAGLASALPADGVRPVALALGRDGWPFVRAQAARTLASAPAASAEASEALGAALTDPAVRVRSAAVVALARRRAVAWKAAVRKRLDDEDEDAEVRASAAAALGMLCDSGAADRLTQLARQLAVPGSTAEAQEIGFAALVGLAALQPRDLRGRLEPLLAQRSASAVQAAAQRALSARSMCH